MNKVKKKRTVRVSERAYWEIRRRAEDEWEKYSSRGAVGVVDDLLFHEFTQPGRGNNKKS